MQLSARPHLAHPTVMSPTRRHDNHNTQGHVSSERAHRPNRTRTQPHTATAERSHRFAVRSMLDAYTAGQDGQARLTLLSTYLGHVSPASTYWYLHGAPELLALAARRLETHQEASQ
jgi:hypothetical protein